MHSDTLRNVLFLNFVWTIEITSTVPVCAFEYTYFYNNIIQFKIFTSIHRGNYTLIFLMANQLYTCRPICSTMINFSRHTGIFTEKHNCFVGCIFYLRKYILYILLFKLRYFLIFLYRPPPLFLKKNINKVETSQLPPEPSEEYMYIS